MAEVSLQTNATDGCPFALDQSFGPTVPQQCRGGFDFTLLFEQSVLAIGPSALLLLFAPPRIFQLFKASVKVIRRKSFNKPKMVLLATLMALQFGLLVLWAVDPGPERTSASVPAAVLAFVNALMLGLFSYLEHSRAIHPSTTISLYLLFSLVLDIPQSRTLFLRGQLDAIAAVFTTVLGIKALLLVLESNPKRSILRSPFREYPPEAIGGIFTRTFLWWLLPIFKKGVKGLFGMDELFALDPAMSSQELGNRLQIYWDRRARPEKRLTLMWMCAKCFRWQALLVVPPRLALVGFYYSQPFLISRLITFISEPASAETYNISLGLIAAAALIYTGIAVLTVSYMHTTYRLITILRGALTGVIFNKTLQMRDGTFDESAAVTLMSTDIDRIAVAMTNMNEVWGRALEVALGIWLLSLELGWVSVIPIAFVAVCVVTNVQLAKYISRNQRTWNAAIQTRIGVTSHTLGSMKSVKMTGLANIMSDIITKLRTIEIAAAKYYRWLNLITNQIAYIPFAWAPALTFVAYVATHGSGALNVQKAFTSLSIISLVTSPASKLLTAISDTAACVGCFSRIQSFLLTETFKDPRASLYEPPSDADSMSAALETLVCTDQGMQLRKMARRENKTPVQISEERSSSTSDAYKDAPFALNVLNCTIKPAETAAAAVCDISFGLARGQLAVIAGPVGSGKTTLLRAILGELVPETGRISIASTRVAYCAQEAWITNITLQQTITGLNDNSAIDERWYEATVHACALEHDFALFPDGDQSVPGSKGLTLSGGQKQRLALARAVYSRSDTIVLDDVFSALDANTEDEIIKRLLGNNGLLRTTAAMVVLATHSPRPIPFADHVIVLTKAGRISSQGPPSKLASIALDKDAVTSTSKPDLAQAGSMTQKKKPKIKKPSANDMSDLTRRTGDVAVYMYYFRSIGGLPLLGFTFATAAYVVCSYFPQVWLQWWAEDDGSDFAKYASVYIVLAFLSWSFRAVSFAFMLVVVAPLASARLHRIMLRTAMNAPMAFFAKTDTGLIINRFSQDIGLIDHNLPLSLGRFLIQGCTILAQTALICQGSAYMAATLPVLVLAVYILQKIYLMTSRQVRFLDLEARSPVYTLFLDTLAGIATIRAFKWQEAARDRLIKALDQSQRPYYLLYCIQRWLNLVLDLIVAAMAVVVVTLAVRFPDESSPARIGLALNNVLGFSQTLRSLVDAFTQLETSLGGIARLKSFEAETKSEHQPQETVDPGVDWPAEGRVEFENVVASYDDSVPVLKGVNLLVKGGEKLGICGRTGSGKSTLLLSLLRLIEMDSGAVLIDGIDTRILPRNLVRERLVTISQDAFVLNDTVRVNLDPRGESRDEDMLAALEKVHLRDLIETRGGLGVHMSRQPLSQGQQQLFCLARAILRRGRILILDEATSNVDAASDALMQAVVRREFAGCTIITVAHRLDTIMDSNAVAVLEAGEVVEYGSPADLLSRSSGFREMHSKGA